MSRVAQPFRGGALALILVALPVFFLAGWVEDEAMLFFVAVAVTLMVLALTIVGLGWWQDRRDAQGSRGLAVLLADDPEPAFVTDAAGRVTYRNAAAQARLGADEAGMRDALAGVYADPAAALHRLQARAARQGFAQEEITTRGGFLRLQVHRVAGGAFVWRLGEQSEALQLKGGQGVSLPLLFADADGRVLAVNDAMRDLLGRRPRTLDRVLSEMPVRSGEVMRVLTATGPRDMLVFEWAGAGGRREIAVLPCGDSGAEGLEGASFDELPVALLCLSGQGRIVRANRAGRDMLCFEDDPSFGELVSGLGRPVGDWLADAMAGRGLNQPEILRASRREEEFYVQIVLRRVVTQGRPRLIAVLNDATEHRNLQSQFFQSQKMQAIGQFAGGIAHDFNNLLTAISGHCDLLLLRHDRGDPEYADLEQIRQNSARAAGLVAQLLAFSRKQTMVAEILDLRDTLSDLTHLLNRLVGERIRLVFSHDEALRTVRADRRQIEQVMMNLVVNARDAMPAGGTIEVTTEECHLSEPLARDRAVVPVGEYAVVRVRDEGVGIPADRIDKIFDPFYTTKRVGEGTGLGLSTVYGIVKQSGGFIFVDSVPGVGTSFSLYLPIHLKAPEDLPQEKPPQEPAHSTGHEREGLVLLVEDEAPVRAFAARALRLKGYTVLEAENGEEALAILDDASLAVDLLVTDVIMPGMDGPTWVKEAMKQRPDVRVIFVSGYAEESFADEQSRIPNSIFLPKPFSLSDLTALVSRQLEMGPVPAGGQSES